MGSIGTIPSTGGHASGDTFVFQLCSGLAPQPRAHNFKHKHSANCQQCSCCCSVTLGAALRLRPPDNLARSQ